MGKVRVQTGFNYTEHMRKICEDMTQRVAALGHIRMERVGVGFHQTRNRSSYGVYASLTPMRFENGSLTTVSRGKTYTLQRVVNSEGVEYLYLLNFYAPRFLELDFRQKLITTVHELLHISEKFDGDIRRFEGRCYAHSGSQKNFDRRAESLASFWLAAKPPEELYDFLHCNYATLVAQHGRIYGQRFPVPKLIRKIE
ncbi:MAG: putative metallopeptidase [Planctomycetia bacterium]|nr:putative metallopeptidase [Planctomycetia bacterium]